MEPKGFNLKVIDQLSSKGFKVVNEKDKFEAECVFAIYVRLSYNIDSKILTRFKNCKYILSPTTGTSHISKTLLYSENVKVITLKNHTKSLRNITGTAELAFGLMLNAYRGISDAINHVKENKWQRDDFWSNQLYNKSIGIIGLGRTGKMMATYCSAFKMKVFYNDLTEKDPKYTFIENYKDLVKITDIISIHVPESDYTKEMINKDFFLNANGIHLINTSRSSIINEKDLVHALASRSVKSYSADVLSHENNSEKPSDSILFEHQFKNKVFITPHIGGACVEGLSYTEELITNIFLEDFEKDLRWRGI